MPVYFSWESRGTSHGSATKQTLKSKRVVVVVALLWVIDSQSIFERQNNVGRAVFAVVFKFRSFRQPVADSIAFFCFGQALCMGFLWPFSVLLRRQQSIMDQSNVCDVIMGTRYCACACARVYIFRVIVILLLRSL